MPSWILGLVSGAVGGCAVALAGYKQSEDDFSWKRLLTTVVPATLIGAYAGTMNLQYAIVSTGTIGLGITQLVKKLLKLFWN